MKAISFKNRIFGRFRKVEHGFSLVEVMIALLIVSTALVSVLGLLTTGMNMVGEAGEMSTQGRIAQRIVGELQLADWEKLEDYNRLDERYRYYDYQGQELESVSDGLHVYTALIRVENASIDLPGSLADNPDLRIARIFVSSRAGERGKDEVDLMALDYESSDTVSVHSRILVKMNQIPESK